MTEYTSPDPSTDVPSDLATGLPTDVPAFPTDPTVPTGLSAGGPTDIALVGMAGRFPGARDVAGLWESIREGRSGITDFTDAELRAAGVPSALLADPAYVRSGAVIDGIEEFDAELFGLGPREAQILDPQHRLYLEHSWAALEDAGCDPARFDGTVGVFAGSAWSSYLANNLTPAGISLDMGVTLGNEKDTLATRVAHVLGLTGPAFTVQSACSTSLVAVCVAASSLASFECDLALAGGVSLAVPQRVGYLYQEGGIAPPDGRCRAFDAAGLGAPLGSGVGVVALRRLDDALADGDRVYAVLRGWAVNNDGGRKVGFTAPGVDGQAAVIEEALAAAGLAPGDIDYVEAHGTGTALGDAAELAALQRVFRGESPRIGSVKTNVGHLDRAAGVTGLIKTALSLHHGEIPATLHFAEPNPQLADGEARLDVVTERQPWPRAERPRRAGVSAFGIGGTNAHVVVEEAPPPVEPARADEAPRPEVLVWSARSEAAADRATADLAAHLAATDDALADIAHTLRTGRRELPHRRMLVADSPRAAADALRAGAAATGVGGAGRAGLLFGRLPVGHDRVAAQLLAPEAGFGDERGVAAGFGRALALARLVLSWGVEPALVAGGGAGAAVAACLAGVLSRGDALALAERRAELGEAPSAAQRAELAAWLAERATLAPATLPLVSVTTGEPVTAEWAADPRHWAEQACAPEEFAAPSTEDGTVLADVGTGRPGALPLLPADDDPAAAQALLAEAAGRLWLAGAPLDPRAFGAGRGARTVGLPTYPFQRERYWIEPPAAEDDAGEAVRLLTPRWRPAPEAPLAPLTGRYRVIPEGGGVAEAFAALVRRDGGALVTERPDVIVDLSAAERADAAVDRVDTVDVVDAVASAAALLTGAEAPVLLVTRGGQRVTAAEAPAPAQAALAVLPAVAGQEHPGLERRCLDLDPAYGPAEAARALAAELGRPADGPLAAHRAGRRHLPGHAPATARPATAVRTGGTYLVTGGLGPVGLLIAEHLIRRGAARLVLTGRGEPGDRADRLRSLGAEVHTPRLDVTDRAAMRRLLADERFDGVVHAAADAGPDTLLPLAALERATLARQFGAKVGGAEVLAELIDALPPGRRPDWCVLFSSTSAVLGGVTLGGYAAANAALAAWAEGRAPGTRWIAAAWDTWPGTAARVEGRVGAALSAHAMTEAQALDAFDRVLAHGPGPVVAAAGGLEGRLPTAGSAPVEAKAPAARFPRPDLPQPYAPPLTGTQRALAEVWSAVLGVEPVGVRDAFFDLSGNSLLALQMLAEVKSRFGVAIPTVALFEKPTVQALADLLDERAAAAQELTARPGPAPAAAPPGPTPPVGHDDPAPLPACVGGLVGPGGTARRARPVEPSGPAAAVEPAASITPAVPAVSAAPDVLDSDADRHIAIVGMAGRFPGAGDVDTFWRNLCDGVESISFFTPEEMIAAGVDPETARDPAYVAARPVLDDVTGFDAAFFGLSPRMAALTDPQQRLFLEVCWEALEHSGYARPEHRGRVGVFGGCNLSTYLLGIADRFTSDEDASIYELVMGNDKDALTTTVSYLLDLRGPSVAVQTFCSTSLVAVHTAIRGLRAGDCEMALAGGVSVRVPDRVGHLHTPGGMESPDGHVRTFDAQAHGSMFGDGAAVVVLKRLSDALRDGDHIWSVIRGSAINNDGALKVGYTAPSVAGQAAVIAEAMADAGVDAEDIGYVEAHGTGTELGDPIEVAALTRAFGPTATHQYCPIGSVKPNVGHLDRAAGATGLIKTSLAVREGVLPPTLHYTAPNPEIDFAHSPFYVNATLTPWPSGDRPRIAGLNSLGMGGTNVHLVVEQPPTRPGRRGGDGAGRRHQVVPVSARTADAADAAAARLAEHLRTTPELDLGDAAFTLQVGRGTFEHRRVVVATDTAGAAAALSEAPATRFDPVTGRQVAFLFTGVGEQYPGLVGELHRREPAFRRALDACLDLLPETLGSRDELAGLLTGERGPVGGDLAALLGRRAPADPRAAALERTEIVQPLMFAVGYALATTLMEWGVRPATMLGYSVGEYVAACLAGVLSLEDALALVVHRARLIEGAERGGMAAVPLSEAALRERVSLEGLDIAAVNGPELTVVAGPSDRMAALSDELGAAGVPCRPLRTTHAFHSRMLAPLADELTDWVRDNVRLNAPTLPYLSDVTGRPVDAELVTDPGYWARHMCEPVRFLDAARELLADEELAVVEIGPGQSLGALLRSAGCPPTRWPLITATLPAEADPRPDDEVFTEGLARLWLLGVDLDWAAHHAGAGRGRVPLPTYPFQRQRYWIDAAPRNASRRVEIEAPGELGGPLGEFDRIPLLPEEEWLHLPVWRQAPPTAPEPVTPVSWLVFVRPGAGERVLGALRKRADAAGARVTVVRPGEAYGVSPEGLTVRPGDVDDALALLRGLRADGVPLERVVHLWNVGEDSVAEGSVAEGTVAEGDALSLGLHTLVALARAAGELGLADWRLDIVATGTQRVLDDAEVRPDAATLTGPALVIPMEYPTVATRLVDVGPDPDPAAVVAELHRPVAGRTVALRGTRRWLPHYEVLPAVEGDTARVEDDPAPRGPREGGVYLITGGLGGLGLAMAERLAREVRARLVLFGRRGLPPRERWAAVAEGTDEAPERIRDRVSQVLDLIALGAEVEVVEGDVAEPADVLAAVRLAVERFGALHGVLHTAGVPGTGLMQFKRPGDAEQVLAPKLAGARAITDALRTAGVALDFLALFSSITSVTGGGPGQVDYCAANAFLDAYAPALDQPTVSIAWGEWTWNAWDEGLSGYEEGIRTFFREHRARFGIDFEPGWRTLLRALASGEPHVVVSTQELPAVVRVASRFSVDAVTTSQGAGDASDRHPRPDLVTPFQEPGGPAEEAVAEVWRQALRLQQVGALDNFFELGGTSLLGITLLATLRQSFPEADLPPHVIHEAPTVAALARVIDGTPAPGGPGGEGERDTAEQGRLRRSGLRAAAARRRRP
ncbi:type I polyketide synthase [Streptomyces radicis]|uniref:KR domain-containing protein n=1 Tax=Streptomyces radicis TaxID=1750517 RepID=A0A3A9WG68_9ACTN|nr:type I polyketide synthase [Streptomyces radicis]RKN05087.1 KR domain-containing protein [Streptomyces radicis]RKN16413.1 KR domain-containing protein [Streptomyces radicis]